MEWLSAAVLALAAHRSVRDVLQTIVGTARSLLDAEYAALGVPDDLGGFAEFVVDGVSDAQWEAIGPLPRQHGMLGVLLSDPYPMRLPDLRADPRFGWWPPAHPVLGAFLGVPVLAGPRADDGFPPRSVISEDGEPGEPEILGAIYLANPRGRAEFSADDERLARVLAAHAAIALENARLFEQGRELTLVQERQRMARELHDAVAQSLFSLRLTAQAAATLVRRDPDRAAAEMETVAALAADAADQLRQIVAELRPRELSRAGLVETLRSRVSLLNRVHAATVTFDATSFEQGAMATPAHQGAVGMPDRQEPLRLPASVEEAILRVAEEALHNALRHASAGRVAVSLAATSDTVTLRVTDDGGGFDVAGAAGSANRLGLASMRERSRAVWGTLTIDSRPGQGATVTLTVPCGGLHG
jgi:signal transduction histidine kinase